MQLIAAMLSAALAGAAVALLIWRRGAVRGTTLTHAWWWAVASLATLAAGELVLACQPDKADHAGLSGAVRLIAATGAFCPVMAVLGARRPQHRAWQFVVITMWIMLALPALEAIFLRRMEIIDVGPVRGWFLWLMIAVTFLAYAPTRFTVAAVLVALAQIVLLQPFLPGIAERPPHALAPLAAMVFLSVAVARTACGFPRQRPADNPYDARWLDFRDRFGAMWALRVIERVNAAARMYDWPLSLTWTGFYFHDAADDWTSLSPQIEKELRQTLDNLLRRFVAESES